MCAFARFLTLCYCSFVAVFKAKRSEMEWMVKRSGLFVENAGDDGCVRLRGLPFGCTKDEIALFFEGMTLTKSIYFAK